MGKNIIYQDHVKSVYRWCDCENSKRNPKYDIDHTCLYCGRQKPGKLIPSSTMAAIREREQLEMEDLMKCR